MPSPIIQQYFDDTSIDKQYRMQAFNDLHSNKVDEATLEKSIASAYPNKYSSSVGGYAASTLGKAFGVTPDSSIGKTISGAAETVGKMTAPQVSEQQTQNAFDQKKQELQQPATGFFGGVGDKLGEQAKAVGDFGSTVAKTFSSTPETRLQLREDLANAKTPEEKQAVMQRYNEGKITPGGVVGGVANTIKETVAAPAVTAYNLIQAAPDVGHLMMLAGKVASGTATPEEIKKVGELIQSANANIQEAQAPIKAVESFATAPIPGAAAAAGGLNEFAASMGQGKGVRESLGRATVSAVEDFAASKLINKLTGIKNPLEKPVEAMPPRNAELASSFIEKANRMDPTKYVEFKQMTGQSPGQWLLNRGIAEPAAKTVSILTERWNKVKDMFDNAVAKLPGTYQPKAAKQMLDDLAGFYERTVNSKGLADVESLRKKLVTDGLTPDEILNGVKRPYEQNFKTNYLKMGPQGSEMVTRANNLDSALREDFYKALDEQGLVNGPELAKEIQASRQLADAIGKKLMKQSGNNALDLFDNMLLTASAINPQALISLGIKKGINSNTLKAEIAKFFGNIEKGVTKGIPTPKMTGTKIPLLQAGKEGAPKSSINTPINLPKESATSIMQREGRNIGSQYTGKQKPVVPLLESPKGSPESYLKPDSAINVLPPKLPRKSSSPKVTPVNK